MIDGSYCGAGVDACVVVYCSDLGHSGGVKRQSFGLGGVRLRTNAGDSG